MTDLRLDELTMPAAKFGGENPLPPLFALETASAGRHRASYAFETGALVEPQEQSVLPNLLQDQYDRSLEPQAFRTAVLENEFLKATFLLERGGRMWSLFDKAGGRELLYVNPVFRPANLATRDAWFSGGVEWNISLIGHTPFTCAPLFAGRVTAADGTPVLRLYEWDRIRGVPWQMDFYLPAGSRFLFSRVRIVNPWPRAIPMYWWSNIAVPEAADVRVLGPANGARRHAYNGEIVSHPLPVAEGMDVTYPGRRPYARDLYFQIPAGHRPWIASIDGQGSGFVQTSTGRLCGRKIFNWGTSAGGRRWQEFLSLPPPQGQAYIEIQAGLAPTQGEYVRMAARATWDWLEAYGALEVSGEKAHQADWPAAWGYVESALETRLPQERMEGLYAQTADLPDRPVDEVMHAGSGWGALERKRREKAGEAPLPAGLVFGDETLGAEQRPWLALLNEGALAERSPGELPLSPMVQREWREMVEAAVEKGRGEHWLAWYQLGIMRYGAGDAAGAAEAWKRSVEKQPNAWSLRNLAVMARIRKQAGEAADLLVRAWTLLPDSLPLALECGAALVTAGRYGELAAFVARLPAEMRTFPRIKLLQAQAALADDDLAAVEKFFAQELEIPTMREGEISLTTLWFEYHEKRLAKMQGAARDEALKKRVRRECPPPKWLDFRMGAGE